VQGGSQFLGDDARLRHGHAGAAELLGYEQARRANVGEPLPYGVGRTPRVAEQRPHVVADGRLAAEEASYAVLQRCLLHSPFEIHDRGNPSTR
jgi:hypothetical protein